MPNNIDRRLRVVDIYATIGDWSKVEEHLLICYRQKESDIRVLERLINLYKEKRETKLIGKYEKKLNFLKQTKRNWYKWIYNFNLSQNARKPIWKRNWKDKQ